VFRGFESKSAGFLDLKTNDNIVFDNSDKWDVKIADKIYKSRKRGRKYKFQFASQ
jgi:hypothetical protein